MNRRICNLLLLAVLGSGCATLIGASSDPDALIKTVSFDHNCPKENIKIVSQQEEGMGYASFKLDVCGTPRIYKRKGTAYFEKDSSAADH